MVTAGVVGGFYARVLSGKEVMRVALAAVEGDVGELLRLG